MNHTWVEGSNDNEIDLDTISTLSDTQEAIVSLVPIFPVTLSLLGSGSILAFIVRQGIQSPYRRLLFAMSLSDLLSGVNFTFAGLLLPRRTSQWVYAFGNDTTCTFMGFMVQLHYSSYFYASALSFYFLFVIRYNWTQSQFASRIEPTLHIFSVGFPLVTAIVGAITGMFKENEIGPGCWINDYTDFCVKGSSKVDKICTSSVIALAFGFLPVVVCLASTIANYIIIYGYVKTTSQRSSQRSFRGASMSEQQTRDVATQSAAYVVAILSCIVWSVILRFLESKWFRFRASDHACLFPLLILQSLFLPAQGFFNFIVFLRPRYLRCRVIFLHESRFWAVRRALYGTATVPTVDQLQSSFSNQLSGTDNAA